MSAADGPKPRPDISIRARPPSPKRLSRKVLLGGAMLLAALISTALLLGLNARPHRFAARAEPQAALAAPESIQGAPGAYESTNFDGAVLADRNGSETSVRAVLEPPADDGVRQGATAASSSAPPGPGAQEIARAAPILFAAATGLERGGEGSERLASRLTPPSSRYEVLAGSVIAAALLTELNSDAPGRVIAQVTAPVFDTVSGAHLLIPQGSRLIGSYDNAVVYGDRRLVLKWDRLIFPDGWSINLENMQGTDPTGAAGLSDRTDNHLDRLIGAIALSSVMSVVANRAEDRDDRASLTQSLGDAAAQEAARTGAKIVDRALAVRPTLRVRAGAPVRVLVMRDIGLRPYPGDRRSVR